MFKFLSHLININAGLAQKAKADMLYAEATAYCQAKEYAKAAPLMSEASELGNPQAMAVLGTMYLFGQGVSENGPAALRCLQAAIDAGYKDAQSTLGMALATGKAGIKIDLPRAIEILTPCAANGDEQAAQMLSMIEKGEGMFRWAKRAGRRTK